METVSSILWALVIIFNSLSCINIYCNVWVFNMWHIQRWFCFFCFFWFLTSVTGPTIITDILCHVKKPKFFLNQFICLLEFPMSSPVMKIFDNLRDHSSRQNNWGRSGLSWMSTQQRHPASLKQKLCLCKMSFFASIFNSGNIPFKRRFLICL